jgi:tRNA pseudouridine55 synthase
MKQIDFKADPLWINVNKPIGCSSARVVAIVKQYTRSKKVGHGGTLDPFASGILPVAINKATKTSQQMMDCKKTYKFRISWGEFRDTDDIEGKIIEASEVRPSNNQIISAITHFIGKIKQKPSAFSAIKIDGKRAYELARQNIEFEIKEREIEIFSLKMICNNNKFGDFEVECSKGTYIRSISRDICKKIGVCGYVSKLTRIRVGDFEYKKTISLDLLKLHINYGRDFLDGSLLSVPRI